MEFWEKSFLGKESSSKQGPKAGACAPCSRNSKEALVAALERERREQWMRLDCGGQIVKGLEGHHKDLGFYSGRGAF